MNESVYLALYWGNRDEAKSKIAGEFTALFSELTKMPFMDKWYKTGSSRKKANFQIDTASIKSVEDALKDQDLGYSLNVWNGDDDNQASIMAFCGIGIGPSTNSIVIDLPARKPPKVTGDLDEYRKLLMTCVGLFSPDNAYFTSSEFVKRKGGGGPEKAGGWLVYSLESGLIEKLE
jgi:hypothetical protein